jgi:hypothetical protein
MEGLKLQSARAKPRQLDASVTFSEMLVVRKLVHIYRTCLITCNVRFMIHLKDILPRDYPVYNAMTTGAKEYGSKTYSLV